MADEFDKLVYVLSTLSHVRDHAPLKPVIEGSSEQKHVDLLNDVALALTTKARGDVTAVTMKQSATALEFFYSKNAPCNGSLDVYLQSIKKVLANNDDLDIIQFEIFKEVVSSCTEKFKDRVIKCQKAAESCGNVAPIKEDGRSKNLCDTLQKWHGLSSTEIITTFLKDLRNLDTRIQALKANLMKCMSLSREACIIGLGKHLQQYPTLLRRVQKLGAYHGMALRFKKLLVNPNFFKLRGNISFVEIPPAPQKTFAVPRSMAEILNEDAKKSHGDQVTTKDIESKYPNQTFSETGSVPITVSAHCELTLALHALNSPSEPRTIEIGVSKGLCWLCQKFVKYLNVAGLIQVFVSQNQGKIHAGWRMPPDTPSGIEFQMRNLVELEIEELRVSIINHRRSDSFPDELRADFMEGVDHGISRLDVSILLPNQKVS